MASRWVDSDNRLRAPRRTKPYRGRVLSTLLLVGALATTGSLPAVAARKTTKISASGVVAATPATTTAPRSGELPLLPVPKSIPKGKPGALLVTEKLAKSAAGATGYRVLYQSRSVAGAPVAVSGVVFVPQGTAPKGGWPVLSYTHGTVGLADVCTPSSRLDPLSLTVAGLFAAQGIAVVASDFEGLGTPGLHPYLSGVSEGRGALDIVRAARLIPGSNLSNRFMVWGHSQGGHASLFAGQLAKSWAPELKLIGVVAGAPPSQLTSVASSLTDSPYRGYLLMVAAGLASVDPKLKLDDVLTPVGLELLKTVETSCNKEVFAAANKYPLGEVVKIDGLNTPAWQAALAANEPGNDPIAAPVLIIHGDKDEQIPVETSATLKDKLCARGVSVKRSVIAGQDHGGAALVSILEVTAWLQARIIGLPAQNECAA